MGVPGQRSPAHIESGSSAHIGRSSAHIDAGRVGVGWGGVGCTLFPRTCSLRGAITFLAHYFNLLAHCIHVLISMRGWGWGGVGCNNVLAQCARIGRSHSS